MASVDSRLQAGQLLMTILALFWGYWEFSYKEQQRQLEPPAISVTAKLEELDRQDCMVLVRAHLDVTNRANGKAWIPALWWNVYGISLQGEENTVPEFVKTTQSGLQSGLEEQRQGYARFSSEIKWEIVTVGRNLDFEYYFNINDVARLEDLFLVPEDKFDYLQIAVQAYVARSIEAFNPTLWKVDEEGVLLAQLDSKKEGPIDVENSRHRELLERYNIAANIDVASLRLKPSKPPCKEHKNH